MSILDQIESAVNNTMYDICRGQEINKAVIDHTEGFTKDAIQRVIEEVNVRSFSDILKTGKDRGQHFPVADHKVIFKEAALSGLKESSLCEHKEPPGTDFYDDLDRTKLKNIELPPIKKKASEYTSSPTITKDHAMSYVVAQKDVLQKRGELYNRSVQKCEDIMLHNLHKIATDIGHDQDKASELFSNILYHHKDLAKPFVLMLSKQAHVKPLFCTSHSYYDDTLENVKLFDQAMRAFQKRGQMEKLCEGTKKELDNFFFKVSQLALPGFPLPSTPQPLATQPPITIQLPGQPQPQPRQEDEEEKKKREKQEKKRGRKALLAKGVGGLVDIGKAFVSPAGKIKDMVQSVADPSRSKMEAALSLFREGNIASAVDTGLKQKEVFEELMLEDEMLREQSPESLFKLYKTLVGIAPNVATNKEIVRSFLRQISSQAEPTIQPYDALQLAKLDKVMSGEFSDKELMGLSQ
jgi:hypothetical protein